MTKINRTIATAIALLTGCCTPVASFDHAFREADRRAAGERELARIIGETAQDRRDAEIVRALVGR